MNDALLTLLLFATLILGLATGLPLSFVLGGAAVIFTWTLWGPQALYMIAVAFSDIQTGFVLIAIPLFVLMGSVLQESGIAEDLFNAVHQWLGPIRGGLAMAVVVVCTMFAAMVGISAVGTITMGIIALPAMLKRGYDKKLGLGSIAAGGALGILIPPSTIMILYGWMAMVSVGQLFMGGVFPGLLLSSLFIGYIGIRTWLRPELGPVVPSNERASLREKVVLLKGIVLPVLLILSVLGSIYMGVASPTEASAIGAAGSFLCVITKRRLNWQLIRKVAMKTVMITGFALWITLGAKCFSMTYAALGGHRTISALIDTVGLDPWFILIAMQISYFFLGMILDPIGIIMITVPVYVPLITALGFDPVWFGILFTVNMEMAFLTPPFGWNLFYLKGVVPKGITIGDIYRSVWPFVCLQGITLILIMVFPQIATWLPTQMIRRGR